MFKKITIFLVVVIPAFLLLHFLAWQKGFYNLNGYDKLIHFLAGASVILAVLWVLEIRDVKIETIKKQLISLIVLFFISVCWEILEYLAYHFIGQQEINYSQTGCLDTFGDFTANFTGALVILIWFYFQRPRRQ